MRKECFFDKFLRWVRQKKVVGHIPDGSAVCDIGCGKEADFLKKISPFIKQGVGLDKEVENFKDKNIQLKKIKVLNKIPLKDSAFDAVTMIAIAEHFKNPQPIFNEAFRILKTGGKLVITTPTPLAKPLLELLSFKIGIVDPDEIKDHKNYFWPKDLKKMLAESGFEKRNIKNYFFEFWLNTLMIAEKSGNDVGKRNRRVKPGKTII